MRNHAIVADQLGKRYRIGLRDRTPDTLVGTFASWLRAPTANLQRLRRLNRFDDGDGDDVIWAIQDVSFQVSDGEVVGIIGRNGAGKTTLLKVLSRITEPSTGRARVRGRVASLLEVGTGFHPELTGRENVYLNGTILGMRKAEIGRKFDAIVDFAGIETFLDTPVKRYSTGMTLRLAFAVAAHLEAEILLIDEVLAVGDAQFQRKCMGKMGDIVSEGRAVVLVSHNMNAISQLCDRCLWLEGGRIRDTGPPHSIVMEYLKTGQRDHDGRIDDDMHINASGDFYFRSVHVVDTDGKLAPSLPFNSRITIETEFDVLQSVYGARLMVAIQRLDGTLVCALHSTDSGDAYNLRPGTYVARLAVDVPLAPGGYTLKLGAKPVPGTWGHGFSWDWVEDPFTFYIEEYGDHAGRIVQPNSVVCPTSRWEVSTI